jgi:hypothetical protein
LNLAILQVIYYTIEYARYANIICIVYAAHPGMVQTNLFSAYFGAIIVNYLGKIFFKVVEAGAFTTLRLALLPTPKDHGKESLYYADEIPFYPHISAVDETAVNELIGWAKETIRNSGFDLRSDL